MYTLNKEVKILKWGIYTKTYEDEIEGKLRKLTAWMLILFMMQRYTMVRFKMFFLKLFVSIWFNILMAQWLK